MEVSFGSMLRNEAPEMEFWVRYHLDKPCTPPGVMGWQTEFLINNKSIYRNKCFITSNNMH